MQPNLSLPHKLRLAPLPGAFAYLAARSAAAAPQFAYFLATSFFGTIFLMKKLCSPRKFWLIFVAGGAGLLTPAPLRGSIFAYFGGRRLAQNLGCTFGFKDRRSIRIYNSDRAGADRAIARARTGHGGRGGARRVAPSAPGLHTGSDRIRVAASAWTGVRARL